jgi:hypothetical protein
MTSTKPMVLVLALSSLIFAALMPPEAYPVGRMGVILCATFVFFIALSERKIPKIFLGAGLAIFSILLLHSVFLSVDVYRSLEFLTILWTYYCLLGFFVYASHGAVPFFAGIMVILSVVVSLYGFHQYMWGFDQMQSYVEDSVSGQAEKAGALGIIATRRVFSTLVLPGTLWGFLLAALPLHGLLWRKHRLLDAALIASALLLLGAGLLTRSFGFIVGMGALIAGFCLYPFLSSVGVVSDRPRYRIVRRALFVVIALAAIGVLFYAGRMETLPEGNPLTHRFKNWVAAWNIFALHPLGTGLNTFGVMYPQYMQPRANETQFVHNTPLQFMSELGYLAILGGMGLVVLLLSRNRLSLRNQDTMCLILALLVWGVHNMIDINVYFPSLGVLGVVIIGMLFSREPERSRPPVALVAGAAVVSAAVLLFSAMALISGELEHRAQIEYDNSGPLVAIETLELATRINPLNSVPFEDSGEILLDLYYKRKDRQYLERSVEAFRRATELSPQRAEPRIWYALSLSASDQLEAAFNEIYLARRLYPSNTRVHSIIRLMENRQGARE